MPVAPSLENIGIFNIIANEDPTWLYYSYRTYHLHLSQASVSVLAAAVKSCTEPHAGSRKVPRKKEMYISKIIHHFISERNRYILKSSPKFSYSKADTSRNRICSFVDRMELLYGQDVATMLRETPFAVSPQVNREFVSTHDSELSWFHEAIEELVLRLQTLSMECIITHIMKIPGHRRPTSHPKSQRKTRNSLADHVLRRVTFLSCLQRTTICQLVLALEPRLTFEKEPSREDLINTVIKYEYGTEILLCLSTPPLSRNDRSKLNRRLERDATIRTAKKELDAYEAAWPTQISQTRILECLNAYREGTIWSDPPICAVCGQGSSDVKKKKGFRRFPGWSQ